MRALSKLVVTLFICVGVIQVYSQFTDLQVIQYRTKITEDFSNLAHETAIETSASDPVERALGRLQLREASLLLEDELDGLQTRVNAR